jgi:hypothetical protein
MIVLAFSLSLLLTTASYHHLDAPTADSLKYEASGRVGRDDLRIYINESGMNKLIPLSLGSVILIR